MAPITKIERERRTELYERGLKECSSCAEVLPLAQFRPNQRGWMGLYSRCRDCKNTVDNEHRKRTPKYQAARQKRWRDANPDQSHAIAKAYRDTHQLKERLRSGRLRAEKADVPADDITAADLLADWERRGIDAAKCVYTGQPLQDGWHLDHAIPLSQSGTPGHVVSNLVPCNRTPNSSKGRRRWIDYLADRAEADYA